MNKISIIKKIQLGENGSAIDSPFSKTGFSFYCSKGGIKHQIILSLETSYFLDSLLESGQLIENDLIENNVPKLKKTEYHKGHFSYRYQICHSKECNNTYLVIFDIHEYRDYFSCIIDGVFQIESKILINEHQQN